jgi:hypothetical protein
MLSIVANYEAVCLSCGRVVSKLSYNEVKKADFGKAGLCPFCGEELSGNILLKPARASHLQKSKQSVTIETAAKLFGISFGISALNMLVKGIKRNYQVILEGNNDIILDLAHRLCLNAYLLYDYSPCLFIDSGNSFNPYAIAMHAKKVKIEPAQALSSTLISRAFNL